MTDFEELWGWFAVLIVATFIFLFITFILSDKNVTRYELTGSMGSVNLPMGTPVIRVNIAWHADDFIPLIGVSYQEAVALVDSLNRGLPK